MNVLAAIRREKRKLEKQVVKLQRELDGLTGAAKALGDAATAGYGTARKRVMSAAARAKISAAAKRRWAKVRAGTRKALSLGNYAGRAPVFPLADLGRSPARSLSYVLVRHSPESDSLLSACGVVDLSASWLFLREPSSPVAKGQGQTGVSR